MQILNHHQRENQLLQERNHTQASTRCNCVITGWVPQTKDWIYTCVDYSSHQGRYGASRSPSHLLINSDTRNLLLNILIDPTVKVVGRSPYSEPLMDTRARRMDFVMHLGEKLGMRNIHITCKTMHSDKLGDGWCCALLSQLAQARYV